MGDCKTPCLNSHKLMGRVVNKFSLFLLTVATVSVVCMFCLVSADSTVAPSTSSFDLYKTERSAGEAQLAAVSEASETIASDTHHRTERSENRKLDQKSTDSCNGDGPMRNGTGEIHWVGENSTSICSWLIEADPQSSIVLKFLEVNMRRGQTPDNDSVVVVYSGSTPSPENEVRNVTGDLPVPPLIVRSNRALIRVLERAGTASKGGTFEGTRGKDSHFSLRYKTYKTIFLPPEVAKGRYNCSTPYEVPEAFKLDMVEQCLGGEDEAKNESQDKTCNGNSANGWVFKEWSSWSACVKVVVPGRNVSAHEAFAGCKNLGMDMGFFQEEESRQFAAEITALSGYEEMIVTLRPKQVPSVIKELSHFYRLVAQWHVRWRIFDEPQPQLQEQLSECAVLRIYPVPHLRPIQCTEKASRIYTCMKPVTWPQMQPNRKVVLPNATGIADKFPTKVCPDGSHVHPFHFCESDAQTASWSHEGLPLLRCKNGRSVHYTLLCDGVDDCGDSTDEDEERCLSVVLLPFFYKQYKRCDKTVNFFPKELRCDGRKYCEDGSDEEYCTACPEGMVLCAELGCIPQTYIDRGLGMCLRHDKQSYCSNQEPRVNVSELLASQRPKPENVSVVVLNLDGYGLGDLRDLQNETGCPETHYRCHNNVCIPSFLLNNKEYDCPFPYEDDEEIENLTCPGHYRCYRHSICIHPEFVCDGVYHCPFMDDERYCKLTCPDNCTCEGYAYTCKTWKTYNMAEHPLVRYLDLSGVFLPDTTFLFGYIQFLNLSSCGLSKILLKHLTNLIILDLSFNNFTNLEEIVFGNMRALEQLNLSNNPLVPQLDQFFTDLSKEAGITHLRSLTLRSTGLRYLGKDGFKTMEELQHLDIRGNNIEDMERGIFSGLGMVKSLKTDDPKMCCAYFSQYPASKADCEAPEDELSSCSDLLRSDFFRVSLWVFALLAISGNAGVLLFRVFCAARNRRSGFCVLVSNLCVSDFLMGVYVLIIGIADAHYAGEYAWKSNEWKHSTTCQAAGFLSFLSSEVSAFIICIITLDRLAVLQFPLRQKLRLTARSAMIPCMFAWAAGFTIATLPLFLFTSGWGFYSQTSICLPLPITQRQFPGQQYAFGIFIVLNFAVFLLIGAGQLLIYRAAKSSSLQLTTNTKRREKDMIMARRLFLVVFTDFCCWFPVGVMGLLAALGVHLPDQVNVFVAVFALPINSAINPFLYTLNALLEKRNKRKRAMRIKMMLGNLHADLYSWPLARVQELAGHCERVTRRLQLHGEGINIPGPDRPTSSLNMRALAASNRGRQAETSSTFEESTTFSEV